MKKISKQLVRNYVSTSASSIEIAVSILILIGTIFLSARVIHDVYLIVTHVGSPEKMLSTEIFLAHSLELVIGIEFIKMLVKHTPSSAVEVLVFAISRQLITSHPDMTDVLIGVVAIAILFSIRAFLSSPAHVTYQDDLILNAGNSIQELEDLLHRKVDPALGNTVGGIVVNAARKNNVKLRPGFSVVLDGVLYEVYSMDAHLVKQVKVVPPKS
ncbi:transporter [Anaerotalea alkaliphila]|uniref:Transporter n=1 Tax=Anaerotalea alkaliphila TaxID=2662126 RepID=A0A7X5HVW0_9FIRM|nr:transporter [Anaerotalea alkaliphila]NDL67406.1 transporter [Anaerotalea alkaliphila]